MDSVPPNRAEFREQYRADQAAGRHRSLEEYARRFPGDLEGLAREFIALQSAGESHREGTATDLLQKPASKKKPKQEARKPYKLFLSEAGIEILVGRTARDNDEVTFRVGRGNDLWLHVADWPGSHVIVRVGENVPQETLLDAAILAAHFSSAPKGGKHEVSYTRRKNVTKFKGSNAGQVMLAQRKSIRVAADEKRLGRLLNRPEGV